jgi:hypothetical protein
MNLKEITKDCLTVQFSWQEWEVLDALRNAGSEMLDSILTSEKDEYFQGTALDYLDVVKEQTEWKNILNELYKIGLIEALKIQAKEHDGLNIDDVNEWLKEYMKDFEDL